MDVAGLNNTVNTAAATNNAAASEKNKVAVTAADNRGEAQGIEVVYEPTKQKYKPDMNKVKKIWSEQEAKTESFRRLVEGLLTKQAQTNTIANGLFGTNTANNFWQSNAFSDNQMVEIDSVTRANAQKDIEEGGYYSVDETAKRLLDFAVAVSGGDPDKIETMRNAVEKGFEQAEAMWGDELPEISQKTREAVMNGFDQWQENGNAGAITLLNE